MDDRVLRILRGILGPQVRMHDHGHVRHAEHVAELVDDLRQTRIEPGPGDVIEELPQERVRLRDQVTCLRSRETLRGLVVVPCDEESVDERLGVHVRELRRTQVMHEHFAHHPVDLPQIFRTEGFVGDVLGDVVADAAGFATHDLCETAAAADLLRRQRQERVELPREAFGVLLEEGEHTLVDLADADRLVLLAVLVETEFQVIGQVQVRVAGVPPHLLGLLDPVQGRPDILGFGVPAGDRRVGDPEEDEVRCTVLGVLRVIHREDVREALHELLEGRPVRHLHSVTALVLPRDVRQVLRYRILHLPGANHERSS